MRPTLNTRRSCSAAATPVSYVSQTHTYSWLRRPFNSSCISENTKYQTEETIAIIRDIPLFADRQTRQMYIAMMFVQTITRELCRARHSHVAQAQELLSSLRKDKSF